MTNTTQPETLRECPKCSRLEGFLASCFESGEVMYYVTCKECEHDGRKALSERDAIALWNCTCTRTTSEPKASTQDDVREAFEQYVRDYKLDPEGDFSICTVEEAYCAGFHDAQQHQEPREVDETRLANKLEEDAPHGGY